MPAAPIPQDEDQRLVALRGLDVLDTAPEAAFDAIVQAAAAACGTHMAALSLVDVERQWFKARVGLEASQTPRSASICAYGIHSDSLLEVPDTMRDERFIDNPLVTGDLGLRFYAGAPIVLEGGQRVGALCVLGQEPKELDESQREMLSLLGKAASYTLQARVAVQREAGLLRQIAGSAARRRALFDNAPVGIFRTDARGSVTYTNRRWQDIAGLSEDQSLGNGWAQAVSPEDLDRVRRIWLESIEAGTDGSAEFSFARDDGTRRTVLARWNHVQDEEQSLIGTIEDLTEQRHAESERDREHQLLKVTLESIAEGVITTDSEGFVTWLNPVAESLTGWSLGEAVGKSLPEVFDIVDEVSRLHEPNPVDACIAYGQRSKSTGRILLLARDGAEYGIEESTAPIRSEQGQIHGVVVVFRDVTQERRVASEMSHRARHDLLTGLINRAEFESRLQRAMSRSMTDGAEHALLFIDLDRFKAVNDACGHAAGDQLLQAVSKMLGKAIRSNDSLARFGGDEFAVLLENCGVTQARRIAQEICDSIDRYRFVHQDQSFRIGASIGLAAFDGRWHGISAAMSAADAACSAAKQQGRNRVHEWSEADRSTAAMDVEVRWGPRLQQALAEDRFELFAQRIDRLRDGASLPAQIEVLLRLPDGRGGHHAAEVFMTTAERLHLAPRIDRWVFDRVLGLIEAQQSQPCGLARPAEVAKTTWSVNLSGQSLGDQEFQRHALQALKSAGAVVCSMLALEITEISAVTRSREAGEFLAGVRALGARVVLDDFAAGASSFASLRAVGVDGIKIDGSCVRDLLSDPLSAVMVRSCVDAARSIGATTTAECVDRIEILDALRTIGVDYAQGFALHRPESIHTLMTTQRR